MREERPPKPKSKAPRRKPAAGEFVTQRAYARRRGVSHTAVQKAIESGRLADCLRKRAGGRGVLIDPVVADDEWDRATDPAQQRETKAGGRPPTEPETPGPLFTGEPDPPPDEEESEAKRDARSFQQVRIQHEQLKTELREIELLREKGQVGDLEAFSRELHFLLRSTRDQLITGIPDRLAGQLAGMTDQHEIHALLTKEIHAALESVTARAAEAERAQGG